MGYVVECFDERGRQVGYGGRGRVKQYPHWYSAPSAARKAAESVERNHPELHTFINTFKAIRDRLL